MVKKKRTTYIIKIDDKLVLTPFSCIFIINRSNIQKHYLFIYRNLSFLS